MVETIQILVRLFESRAGPGRSSLKKSLRIPLKQRRKFGRKDVQPPQVRLWRGLLWTSLEHFTLQHESTCKTLEGSIIGAMQRKPFKIHYRINCDLGWKTRRVEISATHGPVSKYLKIVVDQRNRWWQGPRELTRFREARDIDINLTPSTNMLPINRLNLDVGESGEITTAWVQFPKMNIQPARQTYKNLGHRTYAYTGGSFKTRIIVDRYGLVENYPPYWKKEAAASAH